MNVDFDFTDHGTICVLVPLTEAAIDWCGEHLPDECPRWAGGYAIESRYAFDIVEGLRYDGLTI